MVENIRQTIQRGLPILVGAFLLSLVLSTAASAINQLPTPEPKPGSYGLEATKTQPPPTQGASITVPGNGASFATSPITVSGICPNELLVQVYNNGVMVGSVMCENGSFSVEVSLFAGTNELTATVFDFLEQAGPVSDVVTVSYTDTSFSAFGELITLTTSYGRRSAPVNNELSWPLQLSGGTGPYAFSIDWGDGSNAELKSQSLAGVVTIAHTYKQAGIYQVNTRVTDTNGVSAFLQTIAVSSGQVDAAAGSEDDSVATPPAQVLWIPAAASAALLIPTFILGRMSQTVSIRKKLLKDRDSYTQA
jgi:hypothetical protein